MKHRDLSPVGKIKMLPPKFLESIKPFWRHPDRGFCPLSVETVSDAPLARNCQSEEFSIPFSRLALSQFDNSESKPVRPLVFSVATPFTKCFKKLLLKIVAFGSRDQGTHDLIDIPVIAFPYAVEANFQPIEIFDSFRSESLPLRGRQRLQPPVKFRTGTIPPARIIFAGNHALQAFHALTDESGKFQHRPHLTKRSFATLAGPASKLLLTTPGIEIRDDAPEQNGSPSDSYRVPPSFSFADRLFHLTSLNGRG